jgi:glycosyltransferase involved in cell wall biosynthesis
MEICIVHPYISAGGAENLIIHLAYNLYRLGNFVKIVSLGVNFKDLPKEARELEYIVPEKNKLGKVMNAFLDIDRTFPNPISSWFFVVPVLYKLLKTIYKDVEILNPHNYPSYWATFMFRESKPIVWNCNEPYPLFIRNFDWNYRFLKFYTKFYSHILYPLDKYIVENSINKIVVLDEKNRKRVKYFYNRDSVILHPGVDFEWFSKGDAQKARIKFNIDDRDFVLLQVGWLQPQKNQIASIRAAYIASKEIPNLKLILVGGGTFYYKFLKSEVKKLGLEKNVIFTGFVSKDDLRNLYHACNINLFPCLDQSWGLTPFEALAAGRISIVSSESGAAEVIAAQKIGIVVKPTPEMIAKSVIDIYRNPDKYKELINRGREYVMKYMTWRNYALNMLKIYQSVLESAHMRNA